MTPFVPLLSGYYRVSRRRTSCPQNTILLLLLLLLFIHLSSSTGCVTPQWFGLPGFLWSVRVRCDSRGVHVSNVVRPLPVRRRVCVMLLMILFLSSSLCVWKSGFAPKSPANGPRWTMRPSSVSTKRPPLPDMRWRRVRGMIILLSPLFKSRVYVFIATLENRNDKTLHVFSHCVQVCVLRSFSIPFYGLSRSPRRRGMQ